MPTIDWRGLSRAFLFFWFFSGLCHTLLLASGASGYFPFRQGLLFSLLWLIPLLLFPKNTRAISAVIGVVLWAGSLINLGYYIIYGQEFSQSVLFIVLESNPAEASEYLGQYFVWWMIPALLIYTVIAWWLWRQVRPLSMSLNGRRLVLLIVVFALVFPPVFKVTRKGFNQEALLEATANRMEPAVPWQFAIGAVRYKNQLAEMQRLISQHEKIPPIGNLKDQHAGEARTLVLVIGESTTSQHMSLYGYARPTSPKLEEKRAQLTIFNQAYASRPYTIEALQQVLTFADQENPDLYLTKPSIMSIMKQAGYKTYWITNQQTLTKRNTMLTSFSEQMDEQIYLNNSRSQNSYEFDEDVLAPFERILEDGAERRFIVIHLLGTHMRYKFRYPAEYDVFKDKKNLPDWVTSDKQLSLINEYDNAVLYNDHVVSSIIDTLEARQGKTMMTFFSDHGEDVFDTPPHDFVGRNEAAPTVPMYAIPFFIWQSDAWKATERRTLDRNRNRPYQISHFIHTWADLVGLRFDGFDPSKSLINPALKERPILVGNPDNPQGLTDLLGTTAKSKKKK